MQAGGMRFTLKRLGRLTLLQDWRRYATMQRYRFSRNRDLERTTIKK